MKKAVGGLVYSTEFGRSCPGCRRPVAECVCGRKPSAPAGDRIVRVSLETKGRGGKSVTVVKGVPLDADGLNALGKRLKAACGTGGTVKDGVIEVQGDHCDRVMEALKKEPGGWVVKRSGG